MKKKILSLAVVMAMLLSFMPVIAQAAASGKCGANLTWTLDDNGTLTISGEGAMTDWSSSSSVPWYSIRSSIKNVIIGNSVTSIGLCAFYSCSSLKSVTIGNSVTSIGEYAFYDCSSLESISVDINNQYYSSENGILFNKDKTTLIQYAIGKTDTQYTIPDSVTSIGDWAFWRCSSLESVVIPDSVTSIGYHAFGYCSSLESVTIGNSVTNIGEWAFTDCSSLESVVIPDSVESIGNGAFYRCSSLKSVVIPDSVESIGERAFWCCSSLKSVVIPDSVTSIGGGAFADCDSLESVVIPDSVTSIGDWAFWRCSSLESISVDINNQYYSSENGNLFNKDKTTLIQYAIGKTDTQYTIPDSVTSIGKYAFYQCSSLESVVIPDSVESIDGDAFGYCSSLTSVVIPDSVTSIDTNAFWNCSSLTDVYYGGSEAEWKAISIGSSNTPLTNATIHYNSTGILSSLECHTEILNYSEIDGKYMIKSTAKNNTDIAISCVMYSAVYSSDGTLKACGTVKENIDAGSNKEVDISVPCTIETGDTIKTFMWADNMTPLAKAGELVIQ